MGAFESDNTTGSAWVNTQAKPRIDKLARNIDFLARPGQPSRGQQFSRAGRRRAAQSHRVSQPAQAQRAQIRNPAQRPQVQHAGQPTATRTSAQQENLQDWAWLLDASRRASQQGKQPPPGKKSGNLPVKWIFWGFVALMLYINTSIF